GKAEGKKVQESASTELVIDLHSFDFKYIYIELQRGVCFKDPGTSNGTVVMGRVKIRLPPWNSCNKFAFKVNLIGLNSDGCVVAKGYLNLSMYLHRILDSLTLFFSIETLKIRKPKEK
ncbi:hypothetical protein HID58_076214, partial [Brassica napus]